jgi:tripartite-type tricarboxylate transporter receptor subunit TctC
MKTVTQSMTIYKNTYKAICIGLVFISTLGISYAQSEANSSSSFPNRVIKIIVPFNAGGPADALARPLAESLSKKLNTSVIVENKPGANAAIASQFVAKSPADGYTLLFASDAGMSLSPATQKSLPYDPAKDFVGVTMVAQLSQLLFVGANFPVKTVQELQTIATTSTNPINYASIGVGSQTHIAVESLSKILNIKMTHVPYTGATLALTDLVGGSVQVMMSTVAGPLPFIKSGKIRPLAIAGPERNKSLPQVPTFAEIGIPNYESRGWFGIVAPAKTPPAVVQLLSKHIWEIAQSEEYINKVIEFNGFEVAKVTPQEFSNFLAKDRLKWKTLVSQMGDALNN